MGGRGKSREHGVQGASISVEAHLPQELRSLVGQKVNGKDNGFEIWPPNPLTLLPLKGGVYITTLNLGSMVA